MIRTAHRFIQLLGWEPRRLGALRGSSRFIGDLKAFRRAGGKVTSLYPVLSDYSDDAGSVRGHYFHQDLLIAQAIFRAKPDRHLDVASRIDGFVAHVAAFREIDVLDIRSLGYNPHPNIRFVQADLMQLRPDLEGAYSSVSCLHALEHFGLGRYGDAIDADGHLKGFAAISAIVAPGGTLYVSVPVGMPAVEFNAHRIFDPAEPLAWTGDRFTLDRFDYIDDCGNLKRGAAVAEASGLRFGCGIYTFRRVA